MTITVCEHPSIIGKASINDILQMDANGSFKTLRTVKSPPFMAKSGYIMVNPWSILYFHGPCYHSLLT